MKQIFWFREVDKDDFSLVGGQAAKIGEMQRSGLPVPPGFIVSSAVYYAFLRENNLTTKIQHLLSTVNFENVESLLQTSRHIQKMIREASLPEPLTHELFSHYHGLGSAFKDAVVSIQAHLTTDQITQPLKEEHIFFPSVKGEANVSLKVKDAWAALFAADAIAHRHSQGLDHFHIGAAVVIQKVIEAEVSGMLYTGDPTTGDKEKIVIEAVFGLNRVLREGVTPDHYEIDKQTLQIIKSTVVTQTVQLKRVGTEEKEVLLTQKKGREPKLSGQQILTIAKLAKKLAQESYFPQQASFAIENKSVYLLHTQELILQKNHGAQITTRLPLLSSGTPVAPGIAAGPTKVITNVRELSKVLPGDILITTLTDRSFTPALKKVSGIIAEQGGHMSHTATFARNLGIPAVVGISNATSLFKSGQVVTVNGIKGEIYKGGFVSPTPQAQPLVRETFQTATKIYVSVPGSLKANEAARYPSDGIGLLPAANIIKSIGVHPKKVLRDGKKADYIKTLAERIQSFAEEASPRPVIYQAFNMTSDEYGTLSGGKEFEVVETNPALGYRGAFRAIADPEVFSLELEALKIVRNKMELRNLWLLLPLVRTVQELIDLKRIISNVGLYRSPSLKIWMMIGVPANVFHLEKYLQVGVDGIAIDSDNLTTLLLGADHTNSELSHAFNPLDDAVLSALENSIKIASRNSISTNIFGDQPYLYPNLLENLVEWGVNSLTVPPLAVESTRKSIANIEKKLIS